MTWWEIVGWIGVFFMGAYAGSKYEMSRVIESTRSDKLLNYRGKTYRVYEIPPLK